MITERHIEHDGERVLFRIAVNSVAALDVLTDLALLARARASLEHESPPASVEERLGSFGPFDITVGVLANDYDRAFISVDGPHLGNAFKGDQAIVFYLEREDLIAALTVD